VRPSRHVHRPIKIAGLDGVLNFVDEPADVY
jgi:hypothetical protein